MMKSIYVLGALCCTTLALVVLPDKAQACPYRYTSEYGYNITTGDPETRTVLVPDCSQQYNGSGVNRRISPSPTFTVSNPAELSSNVSFPVAEGMTAAVNTENDGLLNVRSGAGLDNPVIGTLANRFEVTLLGETQGGWVKISDDGWVHSDYLRPL